MTDRELLELAAKAAGIKILRFGESEDYYSPCRGYVAFIEWFWPGDEPMETPMEEEWNPLDDDGDAFRLAVKLRLMVAWDRWNDSDYACIRHRDLDEEIGLLIDQKPEKTVRRAIVMAAAEIGRAM